MVSVQLRIKGAEKTYWFLTRLPRAVRKFGAEGVRYLAESFQRRAKHRAPFGSGYLRKNIRRYKIKDTEYKVVSEAPYSIYVERGFRGHYVPRRALKLDRKYPGIFTGLKINIRDPQGFVWVEGTGKYFMKDAWLSLIDDIPKIVARLSAKMVQEAKR